jgi:CRP/FNR family transcriptional regulator, cyclic AMP receptor protein
VLTRPCETRRVDVGREPRSFLSSLNDGSRAALFELGVIRRYRDGAALILEGDDSDRVIVVLEGRAQVSSVSDTGVAVLLAIVEAGDLVGVIPASSGGPRSATVMCVGDTEVLALSATDFRSLVRQNGDFALGVIDSLASVFRDTTRRYVENATRDVLARVSVRLAELAEHTDGPAGSPIALSLTHQEVGEWVGASREAAGKALQRLAALGLVQMGRSTVTIVDLPGLRALA